MRGRRGDLGGNEEILFIVRALGAGWHLGKVNSSGLIAKQV